jgi:hypothetical protein
MKTRAGIKSSVCYGVQNALVPKYMKNSGKLWKEKVGDVREFVRTYSIRKSVDVEKIDLPMIDESTVIKIFYIASPGLTCKIKITDSKENVVFESSKLFQTGSFSALLDPDLDADGQPSQEKGFVMFEYSKNSTLTAQDKKEGAFDCWKNEVVISMNPYSELIQNSKCDVVKNTEFTPKLKKLDNSMFDVYEFDLDAPISLDERLILENQKLKVRFKHSIIANEDKQHGSLLMLIHYDFAFLSMKSKLLKYEGKKQKFITYGQTNAYEEEMGTETSMTQMANTIQYSIPSSFYTNDTYLEAEFSLNDKFMTLFEDEVSSSEICFAINLMIEYVPPGIGANTKRDDDDFESRIELINPAILRDIPINKYHNITLTLQLDTSITKAYPSIDPASTLSGSLIQQMCALEHDEGSEFNFYSINTDGVYSKTNTIFPIEYSVSDDYKKIYLQFPVSQAYEDSCYKLVCRKDPTFISGTFYDVKDTSGIETKYCFGKEIEGTSLADKN